MYTHIWNKYLPIIKILLKRSVSGDQMLDLNRTDFEKAGSGRKAGYKFTIEYTKGRVTNVISGSPLALDLAAVLQQDGIMKSLLGENNYQLEFNTKFQLSIKNCTPQPKVVEEVNV
ncbi:MAG: hypothetical protein WKF97_15420 [Chitinophagaceae bacterium]